MRSRALFSLFLVALCRILRNCFFVIIKILFGKMRSCIGEKKRALILHLLANTSVIVSSSSWLVAFPGTKT
jgi:hypothetical protein